MDDGGGEVALEDAAVNEVVARMGVVAAKVSNLGRFAKGGAISEGGLAVSAGGVTGRARLRAPLGEREG